MEIQRSQRGFGLLEVVLASGILAMVVGAAVGLVRSSLRRTTIGLERSVAMNLAQEPIEQLRSVRDSVYIDGAPNTWTDGWGAAGQAGCDGSIDLSQSSCQTVFEVTKDVNGRWQVQPGRGLPIPLNGQEFRREVYISTPVGYAINVGTGATNDAELVRKVRVIVRWGDNQAVEALTYLTNWRTGI